LVFGRATRTHVKAVDGVSLSSRQTLALVGEIRLQTIHRQPAGARG
jgi:hypothetical protein